MSWIQIILTLGTLLGMWVYFSYFRSVTRNRAFLIFLGICALVLIISPNLLTEVANAIGVGRGVDLLFYMSLLAGFFTLLSLNAKIAVLEQERTVLAREIAILNKTGKSD